MKGSGRIRVSIERSMAITTSLREVTLLFETEIQGDTE